LNEPVLVGREPELSELQAAFNNALAGKKQLFSFQVKPAVEKPESQKNS
jgi:hypothetical protein